MRRGVVALMACALAAQTPPLRPGPLTDGSTLLATGWRIKPAGKQVAVGSFPLASALSPDGKFLLVVNSGAAPSVSVIRVADQAEASRVTVPDAWQGIAFASNGRNVYVSGGARNSVYDFSVSPEGVLALVKEMSAAPGAAPAANDFIGDVAVPPGGRLIYAADLFHDRILLMNPQSGTVIERFKSGRRPNQILFHPDGNSYFVSSWADASVYQYQTDTGAEMGRIRVGSQPAGMAISDKRPEDAPAELRYRLFVASSGTNSVHVVGIDQTKLLSPLEVISLGFAALQPAGMTPSALALSADQQWLFVACSDVNAVAVASITESRGRLSGFLPVGAYPTAIRGLPENRLAVVNGRGSAGDDKAGSVSILDMPNEAGLAQLTDQALELIAWQGDAPAPAQFPAALQNVVYILDEGGRGANHEKLASEFAAVTNYVPNTPPAADGLYWLLAGMPPSFTQRLSPRLRMNPYEAVDPASLPAAGYLWSNATAAGVTLRSFGMFNEPSLQPFANQAPDRVAALLAEIADYQAKGAMPRLLLVRLGDDDAGLGRIVEAISKTRFWPQTAIFVAGANAPALIVSPYSRGVQIPPPDLYNQSSVLRSVETILKLRPMTLFDAAASPVTAAFSARTASNDPYTPAP